MRGHYIGVLIDALEEPGLTANNFSLAAVCLNLG